MSSFGANNETYLIRLDQALEHENEAVARKNARIERLRGDFRRHRNACLLYTSDAADEL